MNTIKILEKSIKKYIMKKITIILFILVSFYSCAQNGITYYDKEWKITTKDQAAYYRLAPKKVGNLWYIEDHYSTGEVQFKGYSTAKDKELWDGDITWYLKNGNISEKLRYKNKKFVGFYEPIIAEGQKEPTAEEGFSESAPLQYFHKTGDIYYAQPDPNKSKDLSNKMEEVESAVSAVDAVKTATDEYKFYYKGTQKLAELKTRYYGYKDKTQTSVYYNKKGEIIGELRYDEDYNAFEGEEIYFYQDKTENQQCITIKKITKYKSGKKTSEKQYNIQGKEIASGVFKEASPYKGTFVRRRCDFYTIKTYDNGKLVETKTYDNKNNKLLASASYKNEEIDNGTDYDCSTFFTYKNGKRNGEYRYFEDGKTIEKGIYKEGVKTIVWIYLDEDKPNKKYNNIKYAISKKHLSLIELYYDAKLYKQYKIKPNKEQQISYDEIDFSAFKELDCNFDGNVDIAVGIDFYLGDPEAVTKYVYYLYNAKTKLYESWKELNEINKIAEIAERNSYEINFDSNQKIITLKKTQWTLEDDTEFQFNTYKNLRVTEQNKLIQKSKFTETVITKENEDEKIIRTQIVPAPITEYPLLDKQLPNIAFVQNGVKHYLDKSYKEIKLNKTPFSILVPLMEANEFVPKKKRDLHNYYVLKIIGSTDKKLLDYINDNDIIPETYFSNSGNGLACENDELCLNKESNNHLVYEKTTDYDGRLTVAKNINDKVSLFKKTINKIHFENGETLNLIDSTTSALYKEPIYLLLFIDKNLNYRVEEDELHKVKLSFD